MDDNATPGLGSLPPEVQGIIASFLRRQTDLNALSRTCKSLRGTSMPQLYYRVDVRIPARHFRLTALENLLSSTGEGLKSTQELRILPQQGPLHDGGYANLDDGGNVENALDYRPGGSASSLLNILIRQLIMKIPIDCLQMFEWRHVCPMDETTLALLFGRHEPPCLRLKAFAVSPAYRKPTIPVTPELNELRFEFMDSVQLISWMGVLVAMSCTTLQHLAIGVEHRIAASSCIGLDYNDNHSDHQKTRQFRQQLQMSLVEFYTPSYPVLSLTSLTLVGLDLLALETTPRIIDWRKLRALTLKSCSHLYSTLNFLAVAVTSDGSGEGANLKSFDLRSDNSAHTHLVVDALKSFLTSFNGLQHLGLLLEDRNISLDTLTAILKNHGPTLRRLVWDVRLDERSSFTKDLSRAQSANKHVGSIHKRCPLLEELGLSFDWPALMSLSGSQGALGQVVKYIKSLSHLRTLHIRNMPPLRPEDGEPSWPGVSDDDRCEGFITRLVRELIRRRPEKPSSLETIALGTLKYKDICAGKASRHDNERLDEFTKLRVYHVEYRRNFQGDRMPMVTLIAKGTTDAIQDICDNIDILQSDWMA